MFTREVRLSLLSLILPILLIAATVKAHQTGRFEPAENSTSFIGQAQSGCLPTIIATNPLKLV